MQKRLLGLGVLLLCAAGGLYVVYWQQERSERQARDEDSAKKVWAFTEVSTAREISLSTPKGSFTMVKEGEADGTSRWLLVTPRRTPADTHTVEGLLRTLAGLRRTHLVSAPEDKALFGLVSPRYVVSVTDASGKVETLEVGDKNSYDGALFAQRPGEADVLVVPGSLEYQLDKDLTGLRDKTLAHFRTEDVTGLRVEAEGKPLYSLVKRDGTWHLTAPLATRADQMQVSSLLTALAGVTGKDVAAEDASGKALAAYGLEKPRARVMLELATGARLDLAFGTLDKPVTQHFAQLGGKGPVLDLATDLAVAKALVPVRDLRDRHVAVFDREAVRTLSLSRGETTLTFVREDKPDGVGETWRLVAPEQAKAKDAVVAGVVYRLWNLKADEIVSEEVTRVDLEKAGLTKPVLTAELLGENEALLARLVFGESDGERQSVSGGTRVDLVEASFAEEISTDVATYKEELAAKRGDAP